MIFTLLYTCHTPTISVDLAIALKDIECTFGL